MKKKLILCLIFVVLGFSGGILYSYFAPHVVIHHAVKDPKFGINVIKKMIAKNQKLNDATVVLATQNTPQFGKEFHNVLTNEGRKSIIAHPYDKQGSGVNIVVSYTDLKSRNIKVLLLRKLNVRNKPSEGLKNEFTMVAGYTKGAAVEDGNIKEISFKEEKKRDAAEDAFLITGKLETSMLPPQDLIFATKDYFVNLKNCIEDFYKENLKKDPYVRNMNPTEMKKYIYLKGFDYARDYNVIDTAMRKFTEESGYNGVILADNFKAVYTSDNYAITNVPALHTIVSYFVVDLGILDQEPKIYPAEYKGQRSSNSFQPNSTEIGQLVWADISLMESNEEENVRYDNVNVAMSDVPVYNNVIKKLRENDLSLQSKGVVVSADHLQRMIDHTGSTLKLQKVNSEFGEKANTIHKTNVCLVQKLTEKQSLSSELISAGWNRCQSALPLSVN